MNGLESGHHLSRVATDHSNVSVTGACQPHMSISNLCDNHPSHLRSSTSSSVTPPSEEDLQLAVEALGGLKYQTPHSYPTSPNDHQNSAHPHLPPISPNSSSDPAQSSAFFSRVSNIIPLVNRSIHQISNAYEATKNVSKVVKYSAESVETGVKTITKPVFDTLEPALAPLDRFACNQLDKLEKSFPYIIGGSQHQTQQSSSPSIPQSDSAPSINAIALDDVHETLRRRHRTASSKDILTPPMIPLNTDSNSLQHHHGHHPYAHHPYAVNNGTNHQVQQGAPNRTRWQSVVAGVGANLGMISDDTIRALRYCLQYIHYAIQKVEERIMILRSALAEATSNASQMVLASGSAPSETNRIVGLVTSVKKEIVDMIRSVIDMVGKQAAAYLPGDARQSVRGFILSLPSRLTVLVRRGSDAALPQNPAASETQNVLTFATESSNMLRGIENVFSETVAGAEHVLASRNSTGPPSPHSESPADSMYTNGMHYDDASSGARTPRRRQISGSKRMRTHSEFSSVSGSSSAPFSGDHHDYAQSPMEMG